MSDILDKLRKRGWPIDDQIEDQRAKRGFALTNSEAARLLALHDVVDKGEAFRVAFATWIDACEQEPIDHDVRRARWATLVAAEIEYDVAADRLDTLEGKK